jgi:hypothetical protein
MVSPNRRDKIYIGGAAYPNNQRMGMGAIWPATKKDSQWRRTRLPIRQGGRRADGRIHGGRRFMFKHNEAFSFQIVTDDQEETDRNPSPDRFAVDLSLWERCGTAPAGRTHVRKALPPRRDPFRIDVSASQTFADARHEWQAPEPAG